MHVDVTQGAQRTARRCPTSEQDVACPSDAWHGADLYHIVRVSVGVTLASRETEVKRNKKD